MKAIITAIFALSLILPITSACLPVADVLEWNDLERQLNISNNTLVTLAERQCERVYTQNDVDTLLNLTNTKVDLQVAYMEQLLDSVDFERIDSMVDQRMGNYTLWFEREIEISRLFHAIYNNTKQDASISNQTLAGYVLLADYNDKIEDLEYNIDEAKSTPLAGTATAAQHDNSASIGALLKLGVIRLPSARSIQQRPQDAPPPAFPQSGFLPASAEIKAGTVAGDLTAMDDIDDMRAKYEQSMNDAEAVAIIKSRHAAMQRIKTPEEAKALRDKWAKQDAEKAKPPKKA